MAVKKIKPSLTQAMGLLWGLVAACVLVLLGSLWQYHRQQKAVGAALEYLWILPAVGLLLLCAALLLMHRVMRERLQSELKDLTDHLPVVVYRYRLEEGNRSNLIYISEGIQRFTGKSAAEVVADPTLFFQRIAPEDCARFSDVDRTAWHAKEEFFCEFRFSMPDGALHWLYANSSPFVMPNGEIVYHGFIEDITERKQAHARLRQSESLLQQVFDTSSAGIFLVDKKGMIVLANQRMAEMFCCTVDELIGTPYVGLVDPTERSVSHQKMLALLASDIDAVDVERLYWRKDGNQFWGNLSGKRFHDTRGTDRGLLGVLLDITTRKQAEQEVSNLAFYDPLTGLPNRRLLRDRLQQGLAISARQNAYGALIFLDLDNFKTLNDTLGHDAGDQLLVAVAKRLLHCVREEDTVARLGGDEFIILLNNLDHVQSRAVHIAKDIAEKINRALNPAYEFDKNVVRITPSLGVALFFGHEIDADELLKRADLAMYQAKEAGRNTVRFFDPQMQEKINAHAQVEQDLYRALERREFSLFYQPQVDAYGRCIGVEALLRWQHPQQGLIPPGRFIPVAEATGQILEIGRQVFLQACRQQAAWQASTNTAQLEIAVNVSARQFHASAFVDQVQQCLQETGANPERILIELTESILLKDINEVIGKIRALQALGLQFSLDDFGTGYSSLAYLKRLPLAQLKIDQSFVRDILTDRNDRAICRSIIALGQSMGLRVLAEGVETQAHWQLLRSDGCEEAQGYWFAKPLPLAELERWLAQHAF
ncbi:EAL domain-containing protein [Comamonas nitrativorans]|uniref:EAL domain-containing protein n=1 Tax=Comamonas nitrativorans TaxID=108437 RepID=A0ABV9GW42_9BURK